MFDLRQIFDFCRTVRIEVMLSCQVVPNMSKIAQYLQQHLVGEVMVSPDAREYFSTDASILKITPQIVLYPRLENDIRKAARFAWQLAERGRAISITARGAGSDLHGAAIGNGIIIVFPAHFNKILSLDSNKGVVVVQPGTNFGKLQQTLHTHGLFLPSYPASLEYSTIGGAVANNASGERSVKYGATKDFVRSLRVVLSNGEVITTGRVSRRDLAKKKGLTTLEGELYRSIDNLIEDNKETIESSKKIVTKNTSGYDVWSVKRKDGSLDLTPLIVGSQGTLGVVTEIELEAESYNPVTSLVVGFFDDVEVAGATAAALLKTEPSALEMVDGRLLEFVEANYPSLLKDSLKSPLPKIVLFAEYDDIKSHQQKKRAKKAVKLLQGKATSVEQATDKYDQEDLWKLRQAAATVLAHTTSTKRAIPLLDDAIVPVEKMPELLKRGYDLLTAQGIDGVAWGHAGDGHVYLQPFMDLSQVGDRQKVFKLLESYATIVSELGGSTSGAHGDGRLKAVYLAKNFSPEMVEVFDKVKQIFDPYNIMNPGVKVGASITDVQSQLRQEYSLGHLYAHMPRA